MATASHDKHRDRDSHSSSKASRSDKQGGRERDHRREAHPEESAILEKPRVHHRREENGSVLVRKDASREPERDRDRDRERPRDRDREGDKEQEKERKRRDREREEGREERHDRTTHEAEREKRHRNRDKERHQEKEKERDQDREHRNKDGEKDRDREKRHREKEAQKTTHNGNADLERDSTRDKEKGHRDRDKTKITVDDNYNYEDDFEAYDEDFEPAEDEEPSPPPKSSSKASRGVVSKADSSASENSSPAKLVPTSTTNASSSVTTNQYKKPDISNTSVEDNSPFVPPGSVSLPPAVSTRPFVNFMAALTKASKASPQKVSKRKQRALQLLQIVELDSVYIHLLDLCPLGPYEQYMRLAGASSSTGQELGQGQTLPIGQLPEGQGSGPTIRFKFEQRGSQTGESLTQSEAQCEAIELECRWTQAPPADELLLGTGSEKDIARPLIKMKADDLKSELGRASFLRFVDRAGKLMCSVLEERVYLHAGFRRRGKHKKSKKGDAEEGEQAGDSDAPTLKISSGSLEMHIPNFFRDSSIFLCQFSPCMPNTLLTVHHLKVTGEFLIFNSVICVWNIVQPSSPYRILAIDGQVRSAIFANASSFFVFAGMSDGRICAWDLREPDSLHPQASLLSPSEKHSSKKYVLRRPSCVFSNLSAAGQPGAFSSPVVAIISLDPLLPDYSALERKPKKTRALPAQAFTNSSFQIITLDQKMWLNFWTVVEISRADRSGSLLDLSLSPGSRVKLALSGSLNLSLTRSLPPYQSASALALLVQERQQYFLVGTESGAVVRCTREHLALSSSSISSKATSRPALNVFLYRTSGTYEPVSAIDASPFELPLFVVGYLDGSVSLFHLTRDTPLMLWPRLCASPVCSALWSRSRPSLIHVIDSLQVRWRFRSLETHEPKAPSSPSMYTIDLLAENPLEPALLERIPGLSPSSARTTAVFALANDFEATGLGIKSVRAQFALALSADLTEASSETQSSIIQVQLFDEQWTTASGQLDDLYRLGLLFESRL